MPKGTSSSTCWRWAEGRLRALSDAGAYRSLLDPDNIDRLLDARAATWAGLRVVVADVETTGLNVASSRVVSIALEV